MARDHKESNDVMKLRVNVEHVVEAVSTLLTTRSEV
jgi:hypothetical protein